MESELNGAKVFSMKEASRNEIVRSTFSVRLMTTPFLIYDALIRSSAYLALSPLV